MSSLVGYGVSSESEDGEEAEGGAAKNEESESDSRPKPSFNFLMESGSASSESGSDAEEEEKDEEHGPVGVPSSPKHPARPSAGSVCNKLPPPALGEFRVAASSSVFTNPFKEHTQEKLNALQKHVPLTLHAQPEHIGGKKVCVAYRKNGRCRFGIRCKFAHDSDLDRNIAEPTGSDSTSARTHTPASTESAGERDRGDEAEIQGKRKKQRVGVSDSLIPPKRALKQYKAHRDNVSHTHMKTGWEK